VVGARRRLDLVRDTIIACERCTRLRQYCQRVAVEKRRAYRNDTYWARPVPGFGDPDARLLIVGLAPAAHGGNRTGRVFTGDGGGGSGDFLMAALHGAGFANMPTSRHPADGLRLLGAYIAATVRCAPPGNKPTSDEIANCLPHLEAELAALPHVQVVVALGRIAFEACVRLGAPPRQRQNAVAQTPRPQFAHGRATRLAGGRTLIASYHPSRQNTNTGRLTPGMLNDVFRKARRLLGTRPKS
jgi:uracil-DNA glycosylase family 4